MDYQLFGISDIIGAAEALIARDGSGITKVEDLKGKKVAVPLGSTAHYSLMGALKNAGLTSADVEVINSYRFQRKASQIGRCFNTHGSVYCESLVR